MMRGTVFVLCSAIVALWSGLASAIPVVNGNFDGGSQADCSDALISWTASPGVTGDSFFSNSAPCDAAFTSFASPDTLSQSIATTAGQDYLLSFQLYQEALDLLGASTFTVTFGTFVGQITGDTVFGPPYSPETFFIAGSNILGANTLLTFEGLNTDPLGVWHLDDVAISAAGVTSVPEPPTIFLLSIGLISLLSVARLTKRAQFSSDALRRG